MKLLKIHLQKWFVCHWYCSIHHRYEEFLAFILLFLYSTWFLLMWKPNACQIWWWFLNFPVEILKHECWFCPNFGAVLLCLELEIVCKKNGSIKPPIILVLILAVSSIGVSDAVLFPWGRRHSTLPAGCRFHISLSWPPPGTLPASLLSHLAEAVPGPEFLTGRWKFHSSGWGAGICRADLSSLGYHVHACSQTRRWKSSCDFRVEVLFCSVVHTDCSLLPASRTSSFISSYYYCYLRIEKISS